jgi:hypothetical protein
MADEKIADLADPGVAAHIFGRVAPQLPIFAQLLGLCHHRYRTPWPGQGRLVGDKAHRPLPPMGGFGL